VEIRWRLKIKKNFRYKKERKMKMGTIEIRKGSGR
jgi:hypothetical protein